jgi:hypothetical protein
MKLFRYFTFLLSILIISGHDFVPHFHEDDHHSAEHSSTEPVSSNDSSTNFQNLFYHFQHGVNESHLVYLTAIKKQINFLKISFVPITFFNLADNSLVCYANYKKQRFKDYLTNPPNYNLNSSSLRGPPIC